MKVYWVLWVGWMKDPLYKGSYFGKIPPTFIPAFEASEGACLVLVVWGVGGFGGLRLQVISYEFRGLGI